MKPESGENLKQRFAASLLSCEKEMAFKFQNDLDQKLFDLIVRSDPLFENCRKEAEKLLSMGANINAKSIAGDIPDGFMLPAVLCEISGYEPINRSNVIHFFIGEVP